ncbi:MAG: DNA polymerase III subunit delta [Xanthomonadales bacterium]|nr:DNA polymerase III subunit delta [Xanthomonadales bacterium]
MQVSPSQLDKRLGSGPLAPIYLVAGNEDLIRIEAADAIRAAALRQGHERTVFDVASGFDWQGFSAETAALSLFSSRRLLEVRLPTGKPGAAGAAAIEAFCATVPPDFCVLIVAGEWSKQHDAAWSRTVEQTGVVVWATPLRSGELPHWMHARLQAAGVEVEREALAMLVERVEGNLLAAAQEIDKLAMLAAGKKLGWDQIEAWVADSARFSVFGMTEAAMAGDAARALRIVRGLRAEGEAVVPVMNWLAGQVQLLGQVSDALAAGQQADRAMQEAGIWSSRQGQFRQAMKRLGPKGCQRVRAACARLDLTSKGRGTEDPWILIERILLALAERRGIELLIAA